jgi:hypothetical protein
MEWMQILAIIAANFSMFLWSRSESRNDYREIRALIDAIHKEIKDFHGRLCAIEEGRKNNGK